MSRSKPVKKGVYLITIIENEKNKIKEYPFGDLVVRLTDCLPGSGRRVRIHYGFGVSTVTSHILKGRL